MIYYGFDGTRVPRKGLRSESIGSQSLYINALHFGSAGLLWTRAPYETQKGAQLSRVLVNLYVTDKANAFLLIVCKYPAFVGFSSLFLKWGLLTRYALYILGEDLADVLCEESMVFLYFKAGGASGP